MAITIPYSTDPNDLLHPGQAQNFFDPQHGDVPSDEALCAEMARLAYLRHEDQGGHGRLEAILRDRAKFELGPCFNKSGTQGFAATRSSPAGDRVTVVAFRGTEPNELADLRLDALFWPSSWGDGAKVHTGFAKALGFIRDQFLDVIRSVPGRLLLTGHSLGAGLAVLAASLVPAERRGQTLLCTFGCPRVGDEKFGASLAGLKHLRYAGACDLVTWVPPAALTPYRHHGIFRCIDHEGQIHELGSGEAAHAAAAPLQAGCTQISPIEIAYRLIARQVPVNQLSDHAPINYMSALWGLRPRPPV
jgi:pimeloyl-ACP methyl ester carboxylesterase